MPELTLEGLWTITRVGGGAGLFAWTLMWLLRRGDELQRENTNELRRQRDHYRARAEQAEADLHQLSTEMDLFRTKQQQVRHQLKSEVQAERMNGELWRRRAVHAGWCEPDG